MRIWIRKIGFMNVFSFILNRLFLFYSLGHPLDNGLYDLRMGPFSDRKISKPGKNLKSALWFISKIGTVP